MRLQDTRFHQPSSKAVHGETSDSRLQSVCLSPVATDVRRSASVRENGWDWQHRTHLFCSSTTSEQGRTRTGVRQASSVGLQPVGEPGEPAGEPESYRRAPRASRRAGEPVGEPGEPAGEPVGEPGDPAREPESPESQPESPESYSESRRANRRAGELPESPESQPESPFRSAASFVFWTRSTHLGSAHGETTTGQQRQSTVAGRTLQ